MKEESFCVAICALILFFAFEFVPALVTVKTKPGNVPWVVKCGAWIEAVFGIMIFFSWFFIFLPDSSRFESRLVRMLAFPVLILVAILWLLMAVRLNQGCRHARTACLIASLIRFPTLIGIPFTIASLYLLYGNEQARSFFHKELPDKPQACASEYRRGDPGST